MPRIVAAGARARNAWNLFGGRGGALAARAPPHSAARIAVTVRQWLSAGSHASSCMLRTPAPGVTPPTSPPGPPARSALRKVALAVFLFLAGFSMLAGGLYIWYTRPKEGSGAAPRQRARRMRRPRAASVRGCLCEGRRQGAAPRMQAQGTLLLPWPARQPPRRCSLPRAPQTTARARPRPPTRCARRSPQRPRCWCLAPSASSRERTTRASHT